MKIQKVINNNIAWVVSESGEEVIVSGNGIGFHKAKGDIIEKNRVEKIFRLSNDKLSQFEQLVKSIPLSSIETSEKIISYAKDQMKIKLNDNIYISLTDHLNFAIERKQKGLEFQNAILWEIKRYYPQEFAIGQKALEIIREDLNIDLSEDEAGFFALHIVNAELQGDTLKGMEMPEIIKDIVNLVRYTTATNIQEQGLPYERFITHLKFFLQRVISHQIYTSDDIPWAAGVIESYPLAYKTALRIKSYVKTKLDYDVSEEEITYLTLHIQRMTSRYQTDNTSK